MDIEIFSDMVCPWCYLGKRRLETALARFERSAEVRVHWRSFQLAPDDPKEPTVTTLERLTEAFGDRAVAADRIRDLTELAAADGLECHLESARAVNTFDAHRVVHMAAEHDLAGAVSERLMLGFTRDNVILSDHDTLVELAADAGLDSDDTRAMLAGDGFAADVRADLTRARELGIGGVPTFVIDGEVAFAGAQSAETMLAALQLAPASTG